MTKIYQCELCGEVFTSDYSDEKAMAEAVDVWGEEAMAEEGYGVVCSECFPYLAMLYNLPVDKVTQ